MRSVRGCLTFRLLVLSGRCLGLPLLTTSRRWHLYCRTLNALKGALLLFTASTMWGGVLPEPTLALTYTTLNACGLALAVAVDGPSTKRAFRALSRQAVREGRRGELLLPLALAALTAAALAAQLAFYFGPGHRRRSERLGVAASVLALYRAAAALVYTSSVAGACIAGLLCVDAYATLRRVVRSKCLGAALAARRRVEGALAPLALLTLASALSWVFNSLNLLIVRDPTYRTALARGFAVTTCAMAAALFVALAREGATVAAAGDALRRTLLRRDHLLRRAAASHRFHLTAGGMFVLRKPLVLTALGMVCTYGILLIQYSS